MIAGAAADRIFRAHEGSSWFYMAYGRKFWMTSKAALPPSEDITWVQVGR
jgi:hypothetical protein